MAKQNGKNSRGEPSGLGKIFASMKKYSIYYMIAFAWLFPIAIFVLENVFLIADQGYYGVCKNSDSPTFENLYIHVKDIDVNNGLMSFDVWIEAGDALNDTESITMTITNGAIQEANDGGCPELQTSHDDTSPSVNIGTVASIRAILQRTELGIYKTIQTIETVVEDNKQSLEIETGAEGRFLYPLDSYHIQLYVCLETDTNKNLIAKNTFFRLTDSELAYYDKRFPFISNGLQSLKLGKESCSPNSVDVKIGRAFYFMAITLIFLLIGLVITVWTLWRAAKQRYEPDESPFEVLGLNLGIILAIPDIHDLLIVPDELAYAPLIDITSLLLVAASVYSIVTYVRSRRNPMLEMEGKTLNEAIEQLVGKRKLGVQWRERVWFYSDGEGEISIPDDKQKHYRVVTTDPPAKEPLGSRKIKIQVCKRSTMPDLQGKKLSEAISTLKEAGIVHYKIFCSDQPCDINPEYYDFCRVQHTDPSPDEMIGVSKVVTIHVSCGFDDTWLGDILL